jgi:GNAT superfamily N-acetyltransferase
MQSVFCALSVPCEKRFHAKDAKDAKVLFCCVSAAVRDNDLTQGRQTHNVSSKGEKPMIKVKPMDEGYLHVRCLHDGPIDAATSKPPPDSLPGGHPPLPWSDQTLREVITRYHAENVHHPWPAEFSREMIGRYGTCAILAWEDDKVLGHLWFYPMTVARLLIPLFYQSDGCPILEPADGGVEEDEGMLWVQCVMSCRPFLGPEPDTETGRNWPAMQEAGARKGVGLKLVRGLIEWAGEHGWKRIVKVAHADVDCFYGQLGGGGKSFWEKAGFKVADSFYNRPPGSDSRFIARAESQAREKGMTVEDVWTWHLMAYDVSGAEVPR